MCDKPGYMCYLDILIKYHKAWSASRQFKQNTIFGEKIKLKLKKYKYDLVP